MVLTRIFSPMPADSFHFFSYGDCCVVVNELNPPPGSERGTLVFLHGRYGHGSMWHSLVPRFRQRYRCLLVDLPGFGRSFSAQERRLSMRELATLVTEVSRRFLTGATGPVFIIGHDIGGALAQVCALEIKERLAGIVLISSASLSHSIVTSKGWSIRQHLRAVRAIERTWPGHYERLAWKRRLGELKIPALLLWGGRDPLALSDTQAAIARALTDVDLYEDENSRNWPNIENPDWLSGKMREFFFRLRRSEISARRSPWR